MIKNRLWPVMLVVLGFSHAQAARPRVSILFIHYSVGTSIVEGYCENPAYRRSITETLDTATVAFGADTADIVFRSYRMNNELSGNPLSDTISYTCGLWRFPNFRYDLVSSQYNRMRIWNSDFGLIGNAYAGLLEEFFKVPGKEDSLFWRMFKTHKVPSGFPDSVTEQNGYDLVIIKNPYACWFRMTQLQADSIRHLYEIVRDSATNHPEINVAFAFGTPLRLGHEVTDSTQAKITYDLASWFASDSFFTHSNSGPHKNLWKWDSYRPLCELSADSVNKYCLKTAYWVGDAASHLSLLGASTGQDDLVEFIRQAVQDILIQKSVSACTTCTHRGNVDGRIGPTGPIDIADLTHLVGFLFVGGPPPVCYAEGDVDGASGPTDSIDIADLTYLTAYLLISGPPPPPC
ncbi:MAG TPA: hypothetical protein VN285_00610 [Candidatus Deferrimicrobium sp.]|nr:hypothetical protein [Candidatus Deferrimicrobium sp.]